MITTFDIKGFKSVKDVHLDCRRINLFIGEPNTGKSNILEALGFLSWGGYGGNLHEYVRFDQVQNLFYDGLVENDCLQIRVTGSAPLDVKGTYSGQQYCFRDENTESRLILDHSGSDFTQQRLAPKADVIRFYRFQPRVQFSRESLGSLSLPSGDNLVALIYSSKELRRLASDYFAPYGLQLVVKPHEHKMEVQKQADGVVVSFPYHLASDTLQRMIFHTTAIESNKESTLVFEEPEVHAFPYYTKHLGERIALDENKNQYFIATHNPYLLTAIREKAAPGDVAVFATYYRNYETRVKPLTPDDMQWLFEADPFLGVSHLVEDIP